MPANGVMGLCGGSAFAKIPRGQSNPFIVNVAFAKDKKFIAGRGCRLRPDSTTARPQPPADHQNVNARSCVASSMLTARSPPHW